MATMIPENVEQFTTAGERQTYRFLIDISGKAESRQNPLKRARDYAPAILDKIKTDGRLVLRYPLHVSQIVADYP